MTGHGQILYDAVRRGFTEISNALDAISDARPSIAIACTYSITHLWLMPRLQALQTAVGEETEIIARSSEYENYGRLRDEVVDLYLTYARSDIPNVDRIRIMGERVIPVCSPAFKKEHEATLSNGTERPLAHLPLLRLTQPNHGWTTWDAWATQRGLELPPTATHRSFTNYVFLIEAATAGAGIGLGWKGLVDGYLESGRLVPAFDDLDWLAGAGGLYLLVNRQMEHREELDRAVDFLSRSID